MSIISPLAVVVFVVASIYIELSAVLPNIISTMLL